MTNWTNRIMAIIILLTVFFVGCGNNSNEGDIWGRADAKEIDINSKISGRVVELLVEEGQHVTKGQIIAKVDARDLYAQSANAQAGIAALEAQTALQTGTTQAAVAQAKAALDSAQANLNMALADYERYDQLLHEGAVSRQVYDTYKTKYEVAKASFAQAQQGVEAANYNLKVNDVNMEKTNQAKASLRQVNVNLDETIIRAPFDGVITKKYVEVGSMLSTGTPVAAIQDPTDNWVDFKLPETALSAYDLDQEVKVEGRDGKTILIGVIKDISQKAEFATRRANSERGDASDIISYNVKVQLDSDEVRPGMRFKLLGDDTK